MRKELFPHDHIMAILFLPFIPRFITPNGITIARFILTPAVFYFMTIGHYQIAIPLFLFTAFTDILDGSLARVRDMVTIWGTIFDPVADKILIIGSASILVIRYLHPAIAAMIILLEVVFLLDGYRDFKKGTIHSPSWYGKIKMLCQVMGTTFLLFHIALGTTVWIYLATLAFACAILLALINIIVYGVQLAG